MLSRRSFVASSLAASGLICASELPAKPAKTTVLVVGAGWRCRNQLAAGVPGLQCDLPGAGRVRRLREISGGRPQVGVAAAARI